MTPTPRQRTGLASAWSQTLRRLSVEKDISLQDMVVEALRVYVQQQKKS